VFLALTNGLHKMQDRNRELGKLSDAIHAEFAKRYVETCAKRQKCAKRLKRAKTMKRHLPMRLSARCGARTRRGSPCQSPAVPG